MRILSSRHVRRLPVAALLLGAAFASGITQAAPPEHILVFGDSNTYGWVRNDDGTVSRLPAGERWPDVMEAALQASGASTRVTTDALGGRTVNLDAPRPTGLGKIPGEHFNGLRRLPGLLGSEAPVDLVVVMLGTNDMNAGYDRTAYEIALSLGETVSEIKRGLWQTSTTYPAPKVLIVSPPVQPDATAYGDAFQGAEAKSKELPKLVEPIVRLGGAEFLDAAAVVGRPKQKDGVHLTADQAKALGEAVAAKVREMYPN